ncbi:MAG: 8-oxoguanine DNA glycosylase [Moraxellaceae bacterium]
MNQTISYWVDGIEVKREMPGPNEEVIPGVSWGEPWALFTPAYWLSQLWMSGLDEAAQSPYVARGGLTEEIVFCMLGGYGITAEMATEVFYRVRSEKLISNLECSHDAWLDQLKMPILLNGKHRHYRYPNQKAKFISGAMAHIRKNCLSGKTGKELRDELLKINGIGLKTAGWVARNYSDSDDVAILDIHLIRACQLCNIFTPEQKVERDYLEMEARFLEFCHALGARPAVLDCLIWDQMRNYGKVGLNALNIKLRGFVENISGEAPLQLQMCIGA